MRRFKTLRLRFALWTASLVLVVFIVFGSFLYVSFARRLAQSIDDELRLVAAQLLTSADIEDDDEDEEDEGLSFEDLIEEVPDILLREQFSFQVTDVTRQFKRGYGPYQDLPAPTDSTLSNPSGTFTTFTDPTTQDPVRLYTIPIVDHDRVIGMLQVAQNLLRIEQALNQLVAILLIIGPVIIIVAAAGGYLLAARALAPIDQIIRTAHRISAEDLSARLDLPGTDDEVGRLASTLDSMLSRLDEAFRRERRFTADASHELRTPLTTMQTILSSTLARRRTAAEYQNAMVDLLEETDRMQTLTEGLLHLARGDKVANPADYEPVNLSSLLQDVTDSLRPLAEKKGLKLTNKISKKLILTGDNDALLRMLMNLLVNAIKYTERGQITVAADHQPDGGVKITISDTGPGIAPEHLSHIFDRFYRVDQARSTEGAGLGLAIASSVVEAHRGKIEVRSEVGQGTTFIIKLATQL